MPCVLGSPIHYSRYQMPAHDMNMCVYACMSYLYVYMICMYSCMHVSMYVCKPLSILHVYACVLCMCVCMYVYMYERMYVCMYMYVGKYDSMQAP